MHFTSKQIRILTVQEITACYQSKSWIALSPNYLHHITRFLTLQNLVLLHAQNLICLWHATHPFLVTIFFIEQVYDLYFT